MTVHEHAQQTLSAWLDGQVDSDLGVIAGGGAEAGMHSLQGSLLSMRLTIENAMFLTSSPFPPGPPSHGRSG